MVIPKPFTTVYVVTGKPISVPPNLDRAQLDEYLDRAQWAMDSLSEQVERLARGEIHEITFEFAEEAGQRAAA